MSDPNFSHGNSDLITPEEAATLMSMRAGYNITSEYVKQLRHQGKINPAKQLKRTTLYERTEIEQAPLPKRHRTDVSSIHNSSLDINKPLSSDRENSSEFHTWRDLLAKVIADPHERQRIAEALDVNPITLVRWATGESTPRRHSIRRLSDCVSSEYRKNFIKLLEADTALIPESSINMNIQLEIPNTFYETILRMKAMSSESRQSFAIINAILMQILEHLDINQSNVMVFVGRCVPPLSGEKIHSLYLTQGKENINEHPNLEYKTQFLGSESLAGLALITGISQNSLNKDKLIKIYSASIMSLPIGSAVASPILRGNRVAGCLYIVSTEENCFSPEHLLIIQKYANLITLAFSDYEFYHFSDINLAVMPTYAVQKYYLAKFQQKIEEIMLRAHKNQKFITRNKAEIQILKEMEAKLMNGTFISGME